jgi:hypothetical protein
MKIGLRRLFALALVSSLALAPSLVRAEEEEGEGKTSDKKSEEGDGDEMGIMEHYFPFGLNDDVVEAVDDIMVPTVLLNLIPAGGLWGPLLLLDEEGRPKFNNDILMSWLVPSLTGFGIGILGGCVFGGVGAVLTFWAGGIGGICGVIGCLGLLPAVWNAPIAALNAWDRAYKDPNAADREKAKKRSKKQKKEDSDSEAKKETPKETKKESKSEAPAKKSAPDKPAANEPYGY